MRPRGVRSIVFVVLLLALFAFATSVMAQEPEEDQPQDVAVDVLVERTNRFDYLGQRVRVTENVGRMIAPNAFVLGDSRAGSQLLIVTERPLRRDVTRGEVLSVEGTFESFDLRDVERSLGVDLRDRLFRDYENQPVLIADDVRPDEARIDATRARRGVELLGDDEAFEDEGFAADTGVLADGRDRLGEELLGEAGDDDGFAGEELVGDGADDDIVEDDPGFTPGAVDAGEETFADDATGLGDDEFAFSEDDTLEDQEDSRVEDELTGAPAFPPEEAFGIDEPLQLDDEVEGPDASLADDAGFVEGKAFDTEAGLTDPDGAFDPEAGLDDEEMFFEEDDEVFADEDDVFPIDEPGFEGEATFGDNEALDDATGLAEDDESFEGDDDEFFDGDEFFGDDEEMFDDEALAEDDEVFEDDRRFDDTDVLQEEPLDEVALEGNERLAGDDDLDRLIFEGEPLEASVGGIVDEPEDFIGELVFVEAEIGEFVGPDSLTIEEDALLAEEEMLVLNTGGAIYTLGLTEDDHVVAVGVIRLLDIVDVEDEFGLVLDDELYGDWEGLPVLIASTVVPLDPIDEPDDAFTADQGALDDEGFGVGAENDFITGDVYGEGMMEDLAEDDDLFEDDTLGAADFADNEFFAAGCREGIVEDDFLFENPAFFEDEPEVRAPVDFDLDELTGSGDLYVGQYVCVEGELDDILAPNVLALESDEWFGANEVLLISTDPLGFIGVEEWADEGLIVTGRVVDWAVVDLDTELGFDFDEGLFDGLETVEPDVIGSPAILVDFIGRSDALGWFR